MKDWEACRAAAIVTPEGETNSKAPHNWQVDFPWRHLSFPWPLACHSAPIAFSFTSSRLMSRMAFFCGNVCTFVGRVIELQEHSNWRLSPPMERFNSPIKAKSTQRCKSLSPNWMAPRHSGNRELSSESTWSTTDPLVSGLQCDQLRLPQKESTGNGTLRWMRPSETSFGETKAFCLGFSTRLSTFLHTKSAQSFNKGAFG